MESGVYAEPRSYHDVRSQDGATEALLTNTFSAPLPYIGSTLSGLKEYPIGEDQIATRDTGIPHHYTSWNFHTRGVITSFFSLEPEPNIADPTEFPAPNTTQETFLCGAALIQILRMDTCLSTTQIARLRSTTAWLSNSGKVVSKLPQGARFRSTAYSNTEALVIANSIGAPYVAPTPIREDPPTATSSEGDFTHINSSTDTVADDTPVEPSERSKVTKIPARSVKIRHVSFQASGPTKPPMSSLCQQIQTTMAESTKSATQPLLNTVRSPMSRDLASTQMLISYMQTSNGSHIDSAPILRGLCYAAAQFPDMYDFDRITNHFLRREVLTRQSVRTFRVHDRPIANRKAANIIAVTLPAFTNHLKSHDTLLQNAGWNISTMDQSWVAIPIPTELYHSTFLSEYILCFLDTAVWAGRLSYSTNTTHTNADNAAQRTRFTQIPHAHNISVPGPSGIMLVLLDENINGANAHIPILRDEGMNVFPGSPYLNRPVDMADYIMDATNLMHDLLNNYELSASRMCSALEWIETNLSTDMAFQLAFSLAAELMSSLPESPTMTVAAEPAHRYTNPLTGAWTFGVHHFSDETPRHTTSDINAGPLANRSEVYTSRVCGYNWAAVSPLLQYSQSVAQITNEAVLEENQVVAYKSFWTTNTLIEDRPQYQCHTSHSAYRVMACLGLIDKNDYSFEVRNPAGLQSMLVLQGAALTMSLSLYMTNNDFDRWMWSCLHPDRVVAMSASKNKIRSTLLNHVIPLSANNLMARPSRAGHTIQDDITAYYGVEINRNNWALSVPIPYFAILQWAAKFELPVYADLPGMHGNVTENYTTSYVEITQKDRRVLPWYASTGNTFRRLPRILSQPQRAAPVFLPISIENWAVQTIGRNGPSPEANGFVSNVFCVSLKYHFRDVAAPSTILLMSSPMGTSTFARTLWGVEPTSYPDPPNLHFLFKEVTSAT